MAQHMAFATENVSLADSLFHLIHYHYCKDKAQEQYWAMTPEEQEIVQSLWIL